MARTKPTTTPTTPTLADVAALKQKLLDAAVRGRLGTHDAGDESASELVAQIKAKKAALVKAKQLKRQKPLPEIAPDEVPFTLPANWAWVRLGEVVEVINGDRGKNYPGKKYWISEGVPFINAGALDKMYIDTSKLNYISEERFQLLRSGFVKTDDILYCLRGSLGKTTINNISRGAIASSICILRPYESLISKYIYFVLSSPLGSLMVKSFKNGTAQPNIPASAVAKYLFPLPPLAEQRRIVAKLDEMLAQLQVVAASQQSKSTDKAALKQKLLDAAVRGQLGTNDASDAPASELVAQITAKKAALVKAKQLKRQKALPAIRPDEVPFALPTNWAWARLGEVVDVRDGTHDTPKYIENGVPLVTSKNLDNGKLNLENINYISREDADAINQRSKVEKNDIIFGMIGTIGNPVLITESVDFAIKNVALIKRYQHDENVNMKYALYFFQWVQKRWVANAGGSTQKFMSLTKLRNYPIPLPPLAEQRRIVQKLDEMLAAVAAL